MLPLQPNQTWNSVSNCVRKARGVCRDSGSEGGLGLDRERFLTTSEGKISITTIYSREECREPLLSTRPYPILRLLRNLMVFVELRRRHYCGPIRADSSTPSIFISFSNQPGVSMEWIHAGGCGVALNIHRNFPSACSSRTLFMSNTWGWATPPNVIVIVYVCLSVLKTSFQRFRR